MNKTMTLGQALACLQYEKATGNKAEDLSKSDNEYLKQIRLKLKQPGPGPFNVQTSIKKNTQDYTDLFVYMFSKENQPQENPDLLKFFNDNYQCFEAYTIVLNDFLQKLEDLKN